MAVKGVGSNYLYQVQNDYTADSKVENSDRSTTHTTVQKDGISYEKTIPDSVSAGLEFIQGMEKQLSGTKFFVGTVSYGQIYGNSSDTNFVVNPKFLGKLGTDEAAKKQFEDDVKYLNEFSKQFRAQQLSQGREIISQGWFCDENGNWGGWSVSRPAKQSSVLQNMTDNAEKIRQEKLEERKKIEQELKEYFGERFKGFRVKWLEENAKTEETIETEDKESASEEESVTVSGKVGVNVGKTARKIAAAKTKAQLRAVIAEIRSDMQEVKAGVLESEIKIDSARGSNVEAKKEELAELQEKAVVAEAAQMNTLANVNKELEEAAKADQTAEKTNKDSKTDKNDTVLNEEKIENVPETVHIEEAETADVSEQVAVTYTHVDIRL